jgi:hypothetical protein
MKKAKGGKVSAEEFMDSYKDWAKKKADVKRSVGAMAKGGMVDRAAVRGHTKGKIY